MGVAQLLNTNYDRGGDILDINNLLVKDRMEKTNFQNIDWILSEIDKAKELGKKLGGDVYLEEDIDYDFSYKKSPIKNVV